MQPLWAQDLWPLPVYEGVRDQFRKEVMQAKHGRRIRVGPYMTLLFENRLTVKFQGQEILRVERISHPAQVAEELEGFNSMLPGPGELSATLMIELLGADAEVKAKLAKLYGLRDHVWFEVAGTRVKGELDPARQEPGRVSAVQHVPFQVPDPATFPKAPTPLALHPPH